MHDDKLVTDWQQRIVDIAEKRLGRTLSPAEQDFILYRRALLALEMIEDTVTRSEPEALERYLNSETQR